MFNTTYPKDVIMTFNPQFCTTLVGSFPHLDGATLCENIAKSFDIPVWPQLPRRNFRENMYVQYSASLPRIRLEHTEEKITVDTTGDLSADLETFYSGYLAGDLDFFGLSPDYASGFHAMLTLLQTTPGDWVKGQVTGPVSLGLTVTDQDLRSILYNEMLTDVIVKNLVMNARWQVQQLKTVRPNVVIFVDEPYMASFGSAFINLSKEQVIAMLDEVFEAIHSEGGLAGVHCCANTDWSVLLATQVDVLNLDAYGYLENLALYPAELRDFLDRGGVVAWGIVPNDEEIYTVTPASLAQKLRTGIQSLSDKANIRGVVIDPEEFATHSLITASCGLGSTTVAVADRVMGVIVQTAEVLRQG
jgi:hypothetical protein